MAASEPRLTVMRRAVQGVFPGDTFSFMRLETHAGLVVDPATPEAVPGVVTGLTDGGTAYVVLSDKPDDEWYVQGAGSIERGFVIERRDGCAGEHYRGNRRVSVAELKGILVGYLRGAPDWSHGITWYQVRGDFWAENARA